jgi:hypothetical protein
MLPIRLTTRRYSGGFRAVDVIGGVVMMAKSEERETFIRESVDLEDPIGLRLANCKKPEEFLAFCNRFDDGSLGLGFIDGGIGPAASQEMRNAWSTALGPERSMDAVKRSGVNAHLARTSLSARMQEGGSGGSADGGAIGLEAAFRPQIRVVDGIPRLVLETNSMHGFMMLELAAAIEAGVTAVTCGHCDKLFLFGPLTGRRSHARYCSDRCRVAAMRARNAGKGAAQ